MRTAKTQSDQGIRCSGFVESTCADYKEAFIFEIQLDIHAVGCLELMLSLSYFSFCFSNYLLTFKTPSTIYSRLHSNFCLLFFREKISLDISC